MANLKSTTLNGTGFLVLPAPTTATSQVGSIRFNPATRGIEVYTAVEAGGTWRNASVPFYSRQIITTTYNQGGYQSSTVWTNTNRTITATDTATNLGDGTQETGHNYQSSAHNRTKSFTWGASGAHCTSSSSVICFNMRTEVAVTPGYTRTWPYAHINTGTVQQRYAWVTSTYGTSAIYEFNLTTETLGVNLGNSLGGQQWGTSHENLGIFYGNGERNFYFATRTVTTRSTTVVAGDGVQRTMPFKQGMHLGGREANPSTNWRETDMITNATRDVIGAKPSQSGEENFVIGQDWGYCIGFYNGAHVNTSYKMIYATRTGSGTTSSLEPKGKGGDSSSTFAWRD